MKDKTKDFSIDEYRGAYKDYESICSKFSKRSGLSDSEYWMLLMVREGINTQAEISEQLFMSKQTVNSAGRQLVKKGLVTMETRENNLRVKRIILTKEGEEFSARYVDPLSDAEERAWYTLKEEERSAFIGLLGKINGYMKRELNKFEIHKISED